MIIKGQAAREWVIPVRPVMSVRKCAVVVYVTLTSENKGVTPSPFRLQIISGLHAMLCMGMLSEGII